MLFAYKQWVPGPYTLWVAFYFSTEFKDSMSLEALKVEIKKFAFDFCYWTYTDKQGK